jgi:hypothetical protein
MTHPSPDALLELHFEETAGPEREAHAAHVRSCAPCARTLEELRGLERALAVGPEEEPPPDGLDRVLSCIAVVGRARARRAEWVLAAAPSVAALLSGAWAVRAGAERLTALGLVSGSSLGPLPGELVAIVLAAAGVVAAGALVTLALAPVLILESHGRP